MKILISFGLCKLLPKGERLGHIYPLFHIVNSLESWNLNHKFSLNFIWQQTRKNFKNFRIISSKSTHCNTLFTDPHTIERDK